MIIMDCEQYSPEWWSAHMGIPSSSSFDKIVTTTGTLSKSAERYMYCLAYERVTGIPTNNFMSYDMERGKKNEPLARMLYEIVTNQTVVKVGLCYFDESKKYCSSPDGLIGDDSGLEIKDAKPEIQIERLFNGWGKTEHYQQIQGNLFITGRKWWDRMSHCIGLPPLIERYYRDDKFCAALKVALDDFCEELDQVEAKLREMV